MAKKQEKQRKNLLTVDMSKDMKEFEEWWEQYPNGDGTNYLTIPMTNFLEDEEEEELEQPKEDKRMNFLRRINATIQSEKDSSKKVDKNKDIDKDR